MVPQERAYLLISQPEYNIIGTIHEEGERKESVEEAKTHIPFLRNRLNRIVERSKYEERFNNTNHSDQIPGTRPISFRIVRFGNPQTLLQMPMLVNYLFKMDEYPFALSIQGLSSASLHIEDHRGKWIREMEMRDYRAYSDVITKIEKKYDLEPLEEAPLPTPTPQAIPIL